MDLTTSLALLRKWWWLFLASLLVGGGAAYGASLRLTPTYEAATTLLVVQRQTEGAVQLNDIQTAERLANTFSRLVTIRPVMEQSIADGNLPFSPEELEKRITVRNPTSTQLLEVVAQSSDPTLAATWRTSSPTPSSPRTRRT